MALAYSHPLSDNGVGDAMETDTTARIDERCQSGLLKTVVDLFRDSGVSR